MLKQPSENILEGCIKQDRKAQYLLYKHCYGFMMMVSMRYTNNREDGVSFVNQAFLKVLKSIQSYNVNISFEAWIRRVQVNTIIDDYRKRKREKELIVYREETFDTDISGSQAAEIESRLAAEDLMAIIATLPPMTKRVFNLFAIDGYSHQEISDELGMSVGTSKWHVNNARTMLQAKIKLVLNSLKSFAL